MKLKKTDSELRALLRMHWKQKFQYAWKFYIRCRWDKKDCVTCKELQQCSRVMKKEWLPIGKL